MVLLLTIASLIAWKDEEPERLPGSHLSVVEAESQSLYVTEARILRLGERRPDHSLEDGLKYPKILIEPSRAIKGGPWWGTRASQQVSLLLTQKDMVPKEGEIYVLYIQDMNRGHYVIKVSRPGGAIPARMLGSDISVPEAEKAALYVIEAEVRSLGQMERDPDDPPRGLIYPRVAVQPSRMIKGADRTSALAVRHVRLPFRRDGADLEMGKMHTLYLRQTDRGLEVFKANRRSEKTPARLPGSGLSAADAEREALYVADARIRHLGEPQVDRSRARGLVYPRVSTEVSRVISERHPGSARSRAELRLLLAEDESIPLEGETYTLYVRTKARGFEIFKVTRRSE